MDKRLDAIFSRSVFAGSRWTCAVTRAGDDRLLYARDAAEALVPASNQKLFVAAAALLHAGPDWRGSTRVAASGPVRDGVLEGDMVLIAGGAIQFTARYPADASIADKRARLAAELDRFTAALRGAGVTRVRGELVADVAAWGNGDNPHYPSAGALSFNENTLDIDVSDGREEHCPEALVSFEIVRGAATRTAQDRAAVGEKRDRIVVNTVGNSHDYWRLEGLSPVVYTLTHLRRELRRRGIAFDHRPSAAPSGPRRVLFDWPGLTLAQILPAMGRYSDNYRAEFIYLELVRQLTGRADYAVAGDALAGLLRRRGMLLPGYVAADGSGLSRANRASAQNVVTVLNAMRRSPHRALFASCLAVAGRSGTLRGHLTHPDVAGRVFAKTGTLRGVKALSGYVQRHDGAWLTFAFICNDAPANRHVWQACEDALRLLATGSRPTRD